VLTSLFVLGPTFPLNCIASNPDLKINSTYAETLETIGIHTERRGEARNLMNRKSREINMDYEKRLKN
jgi:hypothetical protein